MDDLPQPLLPSPLALKQYCTLDERTMDRLRLAMTDRGLGARPYVRIVTLARTIADLAGSDHLTADPAGEAIQYRSLDQQVWT